MNMKSLLTFVDAFRDHERSLEYGRTYSVEMTAPALVDALAALPSEVSEHFAYDVLAAGAYEDTKLLAERAQPGEVKDLFQRAAKLLAVPYANSIVRLANPPEPVEMATDGDDDGLMRALLESGRPPAHAAE